MVLPPFTPDGILPAGDYPLTIAELRASFLVTGRGVQSETWDATWRNELVTNLDTLVHQLWEVGIDQIFIDGSFVENKDHPHDIDGYFECDLRYLASGQLERDLNTLDPHHAWTWSPFSRRQDPNSTKKQLPMWFRYHVELYPHVPGNLCGIRDQFGNELEFPSAFRLTRGSYRQKGIVKMMK